MYTNICIMFRADGILDLSVKKIPSNVEGIYALKT